MPCASGTTGSAIMPSVLSFSSQRSGLPTSSQRSATGVSRGHPTGSAVATIVAGRVTRTRLPLILGIVATVFGLVLLGALGVYARRRWRARLVARQRIPGEQCYVGRSWMPADAFVNVEPFLVDEKSEIRRAERDGGPLVRMDDPPDPYGLQAGGPDLFSASPASDPAHVPSNVHARSIIVIDAARGTRSPAAEPGLRSEHTSTNHRICSVEGPPLVEHDGSGPNAALPDWSQLPPNEATPSQCPNTPPAYAHAPLPQRFSASSAGGTARPLGPRPPLMSYAQLYGDRADDPDGQQSTTDDAYPRQAEDGGISLAGGPLRRREEAGGRRYGRTELDLCVGVSFGKRRGSVSTSGSRTLPPPYQER